MFRLLFQELKGGFELGFGLGLGLEFVFNPILGGEGQICPPYRFF